MRLARRDPFDDPDWLYELKLDGFRALAVIESGACRLVSRKASVYKSFPGVCSSLAELPHEAAVRLYAWITTAALSSKACLLCGLPINRFKQRPTIVFFLM
jgi:hypothetical protein